MPHIEAPPGYRALRISMEDQKFDFLVPEKHVAAVVEKLGEEVVTDIGAEIESHNTFLEKIDEVFGPEVVMLGDRPAMREAMGKLVQMDYDQQELRIRPDLVPVPNLYFDEGYADRAMLDCGPVALPRPPLSKKQLHPCSKDNKSRKRRAKNKVARKSRRKNRRRKK